MIFFNSSMPRSCSTLLQNVLGQHPQIQVTGTDGVLELLYGARLNVTTQPEFQAMNEETKLAVWRGFCRGGLTGYCDAARGDKAHICIKSRGIGIHHEWFSAFMGGPIKVLVMVRDIRAVFASMEKLFRAAQEYHNPLQNHAQMTGTTTLKRVQQWAGGQPVGLALERLHEMKLKGTDKHCLFVRAEDLTAHPLATMATVYAYLGIEPAPHDFNKITQLTQEDDRVYGLNVPLHAVRTTVTPLPSVHNDILGKDLARNLAREFEWYQTWFKYD